MWLQHDFLQANFGYFNDPGQQMSMLGEIQRLGVEGSNTTYRLDLVNWPNNGHQSLLNTTHTGNQCQIMQLPHHLLYSGAASSVSGGQFSTSMIQQTSSSERSNSYHLWPPKTMRVEKDSQARGSLDNSPRPILARKSLIPLQCPPDHLPSQQSYESSHEEQVVIFQDKLCSTEKGNLSQNKLQHITKTLHSPTPYEHDFVVRNNSMKTTNNKDSMTNKTVPLHESGQIFDRKVMENRFKNTYSFKQHQEIRTAIRAAPENDKLCHIPRSSYASQSSVSRQTNYHQTQDHHLSKENFSVSNKLYCQPKALLVQHKRNFSPQNRCNAADVYERDVAAPAATGVIHGSKSITERLSNRNEGCKFCVFCKNNREPPAIYEHHRLRDLQGKITCPALRSYSCPKCHKTGDYAHTKKYCPKNRKTWSMIQSALTKANNLLECNQK